MELALHRAAAEGNTQHLRKLHKPSLLGRSHDVNSRDEDLSTPLHVAAACGQTEAVRLLLAVPGCSVNAKNSIGCTPVFAAALHGHLEVLENLASFGADLNIKNGDGVTPLYLAAYNGQKAIVKYLIQQRTNVNVALAEGATVLHAAAVGGHSSTVALLLTNKANPNLRVVSGATPLCQACFYGHRKVVQTLLKHAADPNLYSNDGLTPLLMCAKNISVWKIGKDLVKAGVNVNFVTGGNPTGLYMCAQYGNLNLLELLCFARADVNATYKGQWTPLHIAAQNGFLRVCLSLIKFHADPNAKLFNGKKAQDVTRDEEIKQFLTNVSSRGDPMEERKSFPPPSHPPAYNLPGKNHDIIPTNSSAHDPQRIAFLFKSMSPTTGDGPLPAAPPANTLALPTSPPPSFVFASLDNTYDIVQIEVVPPVTFEHFLSQLKKSFSLLASAPVTVLLSQNRTEIGPSSDLLSVIGKHVRVLTKPFQMTQVDASAFQSERSELFTSNSNSTLDLYNNPSVPPTTESETERQQEVERGRRTGQPNGRVFAESLPSLDFDIPIDRSSPSISPPPQSSSVAPQILQPPLYAYPDRHSSLVSPSFPSDRSSSFSQLSPSRRDSPPWFPDRARLVGSVPKEPSTKPILNLGLLRRNGSPPPFSPSYLAGQVTSRPDKAAASSRFFSPPRFNQDQTLDEPRSFVNLESYLRNLSGNDRTNNVSVSNSEIDFHRIGAFSPIDFNPSAAKKGLPPPPPLRWTATTLGSK